jgi:hypothetical protein
MEHAVPATMAATKINSSNSPHLLTALSLPPMVQNFFRFSTFVWTFGLFDGYIFSEVVDDETETSSFSVCR